jgi:hypothetical protein
MQFDLPPRCYQDATMPPPEVARDHDAYVEWLADHLYGGDYPLPVRLDGLDWSIHELASDYAFAGDDLGLVVRAVNEGLSYEQFSERQVELWREMEDGDEDYLAHYTLEPEVYRRVQEEEAERRKNVPGLSPDDETVDMAFRPLLARELKRLPDRAARIEALRQFFETYNEDLHK